MPKYKIELCNRKILSVPVHDEDTSLPLTFHDQWQFNRKWLRIYQEQLLKNKCNMIVKDLAE